MTKFNPNNDKYFESLEMLTPSEIIPPNVKAQVINNMKATIEELQAKELIKALPDMFILLTTSTQLEILQDAYNIDMYRFQFKAFSSIMNVEIKNLEDMVNII